VKRNRDLNRDSRQKNAADNVIVIRGTGYFLASFSPFS
jgi:hypothetical protein